MPIWNLYNLGKNGCVYGIFAWHFTLTLPCISLIICTSITLVKRKVKRPHQQMSFCWWLSTSLFLLNFFFVQIETIKLMVMTKNCFLFFSKIVLFLKGVMTHFLSLWGDRYTQGMIKSNIAIFGFVIELLNIKLLNFSIVYGIRHVSRVLETTKKSMCHQWTSSTTHCKFDF